MKSAYIIVINWYENLYDENSSSSTNFGGISFKKEIIDRQFNTQIENEKVSLVEEINNFYDGDKKITIDDIKVTKYHDGSVKVSYKDENVEFYYEYKISTTDFYE